MKKTSRILAIALVLVLIMSLSITALAAQPSPEKVDGSAHVTLSSAVEATGHTYTAVKIADLYNMGTDNSGANVYQYVHILATQLQGEPTFVNTLTSNGFSYDQNTGAITVNGENITSNSDAASKLAAAIENLVNGKSGLTTVPMDLGPSGADLSYGYWVIFENANGGNDGTVATKPVLLDLRPEDGTQVAVTLKDSKVDLEKTVSDHQAAVGDVVNYTIATNFPEYEFTPVNGVTYAAQFVVTDTLSDGLDFVTPRNVQVKIGGTVVNASEYTDVTGRALTITFPSDVIMANQGKAVEITYSAKVNENAVVNNADGNPNNVTVSYSNQPQQGSDVKTLTDSETVYSYAFDLRKLDGATNQLLPGAKFVMKKGDQVMYFKEEGTTYTYDSTITGPTQGYVSVITTGSADVVFKGLDVGNYVLEETEAPSGYSKLAEKIYVTVADDDVNGMPTLTVENGTLENDGITVTVNNYKGISLPETGSVASIIVMVVGLMIVLGGAAYLVMSRKKAQSK